MLHIKANRVYLGVNAEIRVTCRMRLNAMYIYGYNQSIFY